jgi:hypothetical protein
MYYFYIRNLFFYRNLNQLKLYFNAHFFHFANLILFMNCEAIIAGLERIHPVVSPDDHTPGLQRLDRPSTEMGPCG